MDQKLEIRNTPVWVLPNIGRVGWVRNIEFGTNVSNEMLLSAAKDRVISFTVSELLRKNQKEGGKITPSPTQVRVKTKIIDLERKDWYSSKSDVKNIYGSKGKSNVNYLPNNKPKKC